MRTETGEGKNQKDATRGSYQSRGLMAGGILVVLITIAACSSVVQTGFPTLSNQGMLGLSTSNPYLGGNLFLSKELEKSTYLFNFFKARGAPTAIEIMEEGFASPRMLMFYPLHREVYAADLYVTEGYREWVIRGPYEIERRDYRQLNLMETSLAGEPVFSIWGKEHRFKFTPPAAGSAELKPAVPELPIPTPTPKKPRKIITAPGDVAKGPAPTPTSSVFVPLSSDQQALQIAKGFARRSDNGDVLHIVKGDNETIDAIVKWHTGSTAHLEEIAALNSTTVGATLNPGAIVSIPMKWVKEFKAKP